MAPSNTGHKRIRDALIKASSTPRLEDTGETADKNIGARENKRTRLSGRGLEILAALSGRRISITAIEFGDKSSQDGGTYANVAKATLIVIGSSRRERITVAVKKLRLISGMTTERFFDAFVNEFRILDKLSHPNIVRILGFVENMQRGIAWLVFPWENNGNLRQFLGWGIWELPERVSLIYDVASGLEYLHTRQPPICHGDLKSLNILVNSYYRAVITDFGSARIMERRTTSASQQTASASDLPSKQNESVEVKLSVSNGTLILTGPVCSTRWAPPEYFNGTALVLASDLWALGWIAWEAITGRFPFEELDSEVEVTLRVIRAQLPKIYHDVQLSQIHQLCGIMQKCWKPDPTERLSSTECMKAINWIPRTIPSAKTGDQTANSYAKIFCQIGEIHRLQCRNKEALAVFQQGLRLARYTGDQAALANLLWGIAAVHRMESRNVEAEASYTEALAIYESIGSVHGRASALKGLGDIQRAHSKYVKAEAFYIKALEIYRSIGDDLGRANALHGLGEVRRKQSKYVKAETSFTEALAIYKSIGYDLGRANALLVLGELRRTQSKCVEAEKSFTEALAICKSIGDDLGRVNSSLGLAEIFIHQARYVEAKAFVGDAATISQRIGYHWGTDTSAKLLDKVLQA